MRRRTSLALTTLSLIVIMLFVGLVFSQIIQPAEETPTKTRQDAIPETAVKILPEDDVYPPLLHLELWQDPVPLLGPINTAGAEDSAFITPDGNTMYFFFTPDPCIEAEDQLFDGVTGIWSSDWNGSEWSEPERLWLQSPGKLALDGAPFVLEDVMWFASAREYDEYEEDHRDINLFTARYVDGKWNNWTYAGDRLNLEFEMGEMHRSQDLTELYFHSSREGGLGQNDIWVTRFVNEEWSEPENVQAVNSEANEGRPFLSHDGNELWFDREYMGSPSIWRSLKVENNWTAPQLIVSSFAAEPTLDQYGNLYFIHHFIKDGVMLEADIYVAYRK